MRVVHAESNFLSSIQITKSEAKAAFGDATVYLEKFLEKPRHVEVQVLADKHGNAIHLFDRDCSLQRRHQKLLEEAPAPRVDPKARAQVLRLVLQPVKIWVTSVPVLLSFCMKTAVSTSSK